VSGAARPAPLVTVGKAGHAPTLDPYKPLLSAREYLKRRRIELRHQGAFFQYDGSAYRLRDEQAVRADLYRFLEGARRQDDQGELVAFDPTRAKVDNAIDALRAVTNLPATTQAPCWLDDDPGLDPFDVMSCSNGLVHIPSRILLPATPTFYTHQAVPFAFDPDARPPVHWLQFMDSVFHDLESRELLQEWCGYLLTPSTRFQKILLWVAPARSGKGATFRVVRQLIGAGSYCCPSLRDLSGTFGLESLIGRSCAVISDARMSSRTDAAARP
jgi:putative DNA primase/helicase